MNTTVTNEMVLFEYFDKPSYVKLVAFQRFSKSPGLESIVTVEVRGVPAEGFEFGKKYKITITPA
jgi:hypothetical protein